MRRSLVASSAAFLATMIAMPALANVANSPVIALHVKARNAKPDILGLTCSQYIVKGDLDTGYDVYMVVANIDSTTVAGGGIKGVSCGVYYDSESGRGVDCFGWTLCTDGQEFPNSRWPAPGSGSRISWVTCQDQPIRPDGKYGGVHAVVGVFYLFAYDQAAFHVVPNRGIGGDLSVADCAGAETELDSISGLGWVGFGGAIGETPCTFEPPFRPRPADRSLGNTANGAPSPVCGFTPVELSTWGRIKARYE